MVGVLEAHAVLLNHIFLRKYFVLSDWHHEIFKSSVLQDGWVTSRSVKFSYLRSAVLHVYISVAHRPVELKETLLV